MSNRLIAPFLSFLDSSGAVLSGGTLTFSESGTSTPLDTYSDSALTVANANPITLDSAGHPSDGAGTEVDVFGLNKAYRIILKNSAGTTIRTYDPVWPVGVSTVNVILPGICDGRLTLTTGVPVTTSDVTAATTLYFTPYRGNRIALYDGTATWKPYNFTERSIAVPATTSTVYDVFIYDNAGTLTLELTAWSSATARATAITLQDGVYVKSGATTRRYLGSFSTTTVSGQTEDSIAKRYLWNYYNRIPRTMRVLETTASWVYTTATVRQANGSAANQIGFVIGVSEDIVKAKIHAAASNPTAGVKMAVGFGLDTTSAMGSAGQVRIGHQTAVANINVPLLCKFKNYVAIGRHFLSWNEYSVATGTTTWLGIDTDATLYQAGIIGELPA